jgi:hypothetical protein
MGDEKGVFLWIKQIPYSFKKQEGSNSHPKKACD